MKNLFVIVTTTLLTTMTALAGGKNCKALAYQKALQYTLSIPHPYELYFSEEETSEPNTYRYSALAELAWVFEIEVTVDNQEECEIVSIEKK